MDGIASGIYTTLVLFIQVVAPMFIMFTAYIAIFAKIRRESSKGLSINDAEDNISQQHKARSRLFMRAQHRTLRMIITIFLAFVVNWTPYVVAALVYAWHFSDHPASLAMRIVYEVAFLFGLSNSCFNPLVYGCCNLHIFDSFCASCCAVIIGRPDSSMTDQKTSTYTMRWSMKSSPTAKQGYLSNDGFLSGIKWTFDFRQMIVTCRSHDEIQRTQLRRIKISRSQVYAGNGCLETHGEEKENFDAT
ncbi:oxytocin receptor isoform X1 [Strongylocentrotus purpuratus]|uniref:G-protein coupled receptors family 1 profile domain-containing protein n=1 Tax=Strongylocentrotus purpuratus TaxID=7668 RepID=A0A7M7N9B6_STRPU|nr:oxytocin receptor isoform X1 [Strongylocentrotus purpuratus]